VDLGTPAIVTDRARSRRAGFWLAQIGGWLAYGLGAYLAHLPTLPAEERAGLLVHRALRVLVCFAASLVLLHLYRSLFARGARPSRAAAVALPTCLVLGAAGFFIHAGLVSLAGVVPRGTEAVDWAVGPRGVLDFSFALLGWSAAYFGFRLWEASEEREREAQEARALAQDAQLRMLAYQLNPHFLFNALNSIRAMIDLDGGRARQMITELAGFMRYALLTRPMRAARLDAELAALRGYLAIEQIRFEERLVVRIDVEPDALACLVPSFLLHPLLENALKHGRPAANGVLRVELRAAVREGALEVTIANTGRLAAPAGGEGVGLENVRARLERLYPARHRFRIAGKEGWVRAEIVLPTVRPADREAFAGAGADA